MNILTVKYLPWWEPEKIITESAPILPACYGINYVHLNVKFFSSDMRVKIENIEKYTYPDIVVACEKIEFLEDELDSLLNPVVIIEILSDSTEAYDRGLKFEHYQLIKSLQEYILISQYSFNVVKYVRHGDNGWLYTSYSDLNKALKIESIKCELSLGEIYQRVEFKK